MIKQVSNKKELKAFIRFPHRLYQDDPNYVPLPNMQLRSFLNPRHNAFFQHSEAKYYLAYEKGQLVGRIAAILNRNHLERYQDDTGFFGFFEGYNKPDIAHQLLDKAANSLREYGIKRIIGPENFTTNDSVGILVDGYDSPPCINMPYNKPYYEKLLTDYGFRTAIELYHYRFSNENWGKYYQERFGKIEIRLKNAGIIVRPLRKKHFKADVKALRYLYNTANADNWGFVPLTEAEFSGMAKELIQIVEPESILIAEKNGQPVGYLVAVPDLNPIFQTLRNGKLSIPGFIRLLNWKKHVKNIRVMILGVLPEYRKKGIDIVFYRHLHIYMKKRGLEYAEPCYVMEKNLRMLNLLRHLQLEHIKTYRLMQCDI